MLFFLYNYFVSVFTQETAVESFVGCKMAQPEEVLAHTADWVLMWYLLAGLCGDFSFFDSRQRCWPVVSGFAAMGTSRKGSPSLAFSPCCWIYSFCQQPSKSTPCQCALQTKGHPNIWPHCRLLSRLSLGSICLWILSQPLFDLSDSKKKLLSPIMC